MKYLLILISALALAEIGFAQQIPTEKPKPKEEELIKKAEVSISCNYREKTDRELSEPDMPAIGYNTAFYIYDFIFTLDYGQNPFAYSERRKFTGKLFNASLDFFNSLNKYFSFMSNLTYTYYTDKSAPNEYQVFAAFLFRVSKFSFRAQGQYYFYESYDQYGEKYKSRDEITPGIYANIDIGYGLYANSTLSYPSIYYTDPETWESANHKYIKNTVSFGFRKSFPDIGMDFSAVYSKDFAFKSKKEYPFALDDYAMPMRLSMISSTINLTKKGDVSLTLRIKDIKTDYFQDFYLGFSVNVVIGE